MLSDNALNAQIAQQLFGWTLFPGDGWWEDGNGRMHRHLPAYTTDPAATALVWQWLETRGHPLGALTFAYIEVYVQCTVVLLDVSAQGTGVTWSEALCRAALALAEAVALAEERP